MIITICQNCNRPATFHDGIYAYCSDECAALHFAALNELHDVLSVSAERSSFEQINTMTTDEFKTLASLMEDFKNA